MDDKKYPNMNSVKIAAEAAERLGFSDKQRSDLLDELSMLPNGPVKHALSLFSEGGMPKKRVVLDVDDVMWPLNEHVAWLANVDFNDIVTFFAPDNYMLDDAAKKRLYEAYQTPWLHVHMDFYPDARLFATLAHDSRIEPWIASNNTSQTARNDKLCNLKDFFGPDLNRFSLHMPVVDMADTHEKIFPDDIFCLIDDSPKNAVKSGAQHVLMRKKPWNQSAWGQGVMKNILPRVRFYDDTAQCICMLQELLMKEDEWDVQKKELAAKNFGL